MRSSAFRITAVYVIVGILWILLSDRLVATLVADSDRLASIQILKGWFFVFATGGLLYLLLRQNERAEERTREQASLVEKVHDAIVVYDAQDRVAFWNEAAQRIYGWAASEALGKQSKDFFQSHPEEMKELEQARTAVFQKGEWSGELYLHTKDGRKIIVELRRTLLRDAQGAPRRKLVMSSDITEKKTLEAQVHRTQRPGKPRRPGQRHCPRPQQHVDPHSDVGEVATEKPGGGQTPALARRPAGRC